MTLHETLKCGGKHPHETRSAAEKVAKRMSRNRDARVQVYLCPYCARWHIGHGRRDNAKR